jgi:amino acid transporter/nucleotide-binding universal stress UspA family protein
VKHGHRRGRRSQQRLLEVVIAEKLRRELGFWDALTIGVGTMIGAGIFLLAGVALELTGPAAILSYVFAGIVCMMTAASTAELATGMPESGGDYYFVSRALGPMFGAISGVGIWLSLTFAIAFYLVGMGEYVIQIFARLAERFETLSMLANTPVGVAAAVGGVLLLILNVIGAKQSGRTQLFVVLALLVILSVFTVGGLLHVEPSNLTPFFAEGTGTIFSTTALVFVSFLGFVKIAAVSEEIEDPSKNLPRTLIGSVLIVTALYVLILVVLGGMFTHTEVGRIKDPLTKAAQVIFGPLGGVALIAAGLLATLSSANASVLAASRINLAMARDRMVPGFFSKIHKSFLTPHRAILITGGLALIFISLESLELLAKIASVLQLYSYAALNIGCVVLRAAAPEWYRPSYRAPGYPFVQLIAAAACLTIIYYSGFLPMIAIVVLIAVSLLWYFVVARSNIEMVHSLPQLKERWSSIGLAAFFYAPEVTATDAETEEGPARLAKRPIEPHSPRRVVVALSNPATERDLLEMGSLISRGSGEGGEVFGLHVVRVPRQTTLEAARTQIEGLDDVKRVRRLVDELEDNRREEPGAPSFEPLITVAHDPFNGLLDETEQARADMLLMGWEGGFNVGNIYESPVQHVISNATSDVAMLKDRGLETLDRILLPWGGGVHARLGLEIAARIAMDTGATIDLLRVVRADVDVEQEEQRVIESVMEIVEEVVAGGNVDLVYHVQRARRVVQGIKAQLDESPYDLVIIGASHEWSMRNVLFGSIPDVVADQAGCSVLMVRRHLPEHWSFKATESIKKWRESAGFTTSPSDDED